MYLKYDREKETEFNKKIELKPHNRKNFYSFINKEVKIVLEGKFYYYNSGIIIYFVSLFIFRTFKDKELVFARQYLGGLLKG